jgi:hypothetical protein
MTPHERFIHHQRLAAIQIHMRQAMARTGRGYRSYSTKTGPFESERKRDPFPPSLRRLRLVRRVA